jgi:hypothetical protein
MRHPEVPQNVLICCVELITQVQPSLQNLTRIVLGYEGLRVENRSSEFAQLRIAVSKNIERIGT